MTTLFRNEFTNETKTICHHSIPHSVIQLIILGKNFINCTLLVKYEKHSFERKDRKKAQRRRFMLLQDSLLKIP